MYEKKIPMELGCGMNVFMEVIHGKWRMNLIWHIHNGISRPGQLHRCIPKASRRLLDAQLSQLVHLGILQKTVYDQKPPKVEYRLTELGQSMLPVIEVSARWGEAHRLQLEPLLQQNTLGAALVE